MSVKLLDSVTIVCPQPRMRPPIPYEYSKLYAVSLLLEENLNFINELKFLVLKLQKSSIPSTSPRPLGL